MSVEARMQIAGMTCAYCEKTVTEALRAAGAHGVQARWQPGLAEFDPGDATDEQLSAAVEQAGYRVRSVERVHQRRTPGVEPVAGDRGHDFDLIVLGAGSAAFAAAITATDAGAKVTMVEPGTVGGTCVNVGCVPSKAMIAPADHFFRAGHHPFAGIDTRAVSADLAAMVDSKAALVDRLRQEKYVDLAESYGFTICRGRAEFVDAETIRCDGQQLRAPAVLIATGASPSVPPIPGLLESGYLTSTSALELREPPRELIVIGANAIGLEMGQLFLDLGSRLTILEAMPRITPMEEPETSEALQAVLEEAGATVITGAAISRVDRSGGVRTVKFTHDGEERTVSGDQIIVATGRRPNTDDLGLDRAGIEVSPRGAVVVDGALRTTNPRVWAAGDVTGHPQFVYVAAYEGSMAARNAVMGHSETVDFRSLPRVIFTSPTFAGAGTTDEQAAEQGIACECRVLPMSAVPRALVNRDTRGFVKIVAESATGRIVGASAVADGAGDVIQAAVYAIQLGLTTEQVANTWAPYLTFAEGFKLAAQTFTRDVSKLSCCAA